MIIQVKGLSHIYNAGQPDESHALRDINLTFSSEDFTGIIGHTGSGKSTLVQHLNGLIKPSSGTVEIDGQDINEETKEARARRQDIGLVFQYPEYQLFDETIYDDIAFGPNNQGLEGQDLEDRVYQAMARVGLDKGLASRSPFEISGGQRRRVAIAGVIAMEPKILVLDEPTAGLDPAGRENILSMISRLHESGVGIIFISHSMEDIARLCNRIVVLDGGRVQYLGSAREVFSQADKLQALGLDVPQISTFMNKLALKYPGLRTDILTIEEAREEINRVLGDKDV